MVSLFPDVKPNGEIAKLKCSDYDVGNGICDPQCNFEHSLWDLGDCCQPFHTAYWCNEGQWDWGKYNFGQKSQDNEQIGAYDLPNQSAQTYEGDYSKMVEKPNCYCHITGDNAAKPYGNQSHCICRIFTNSFLPGLRYLVYSLE